jgi:hypothetical protein
VRPEERGVAGRRARGRGGSATGNAAVRWRGGRAAGRRGEGAVAINEERDGPFSPFVGSGMTRG